MNHVWTRMSKSKQIFLYVVTRRSYPWQCERPVRHFFWIHFQSKISRALANFTLLWKQKYIILVFMQTKQCYKFFLDIYAFTYLASFTYLPSSCFTIIEWISCLVVIFMFYFTIFSLWLTAIHTSWKTKPDLSQNKSWLLL